MPTSSVRFATARSVSAEPERRRPFGVGCDAVPCAQVHPVSVADNWSKDVATEMALWSVGESTTAKLVLVACDALVGGLDSQPLRELAGASGTSSNYDIEDILERLAHEHDVPFYRRHSSAGRKAAARVLAAQCVAGDLPPRELARWMHTRIKHGHDDPLVEALVSLDDQYDVCDYSGESPDVVDRAVVEAAARLVDSQ